MTRAERDAFLLGCQGPDPFFFATRTPRIISLKQFGTCLHSENVDSSIDHMLKTVAESKEHDRLVLEAYMCGYLCHYALDSYAHPFVVSWVQALCSAGVNRLDERDSQFVHIQIEADLDAFLLWHLLGKTVADIRITRYTLQGNKKVLSVIDSLFAPLGQVLYGFDMSSEPYSRSIHDMRMTYDFIQSTSGRKRALIGWVERRVPKRRHSLMQALSHRTDVYDQCAFANLGHDPWIDSENEEERNESFLDIFDAASDAAVSFVNAVLSGGVEAHTLTNGVDFDGIKRS